MSSDNQMNVGAVDVNSDSSDTRRHIHAVVSGVDAVDSSLGEKHQIISQNENSILPKSVGMKCDMDSDNDGVNDCDDACPLNPKRTVGECGCEFLKSFPGVCGCDTFDFDRDLDRVMDCEDECPDDSSKSKAGQCGCGSVDVDWDNDGVSDCIDLCPRDESKIAPGVCGCGEKDIVIVPFLTICKSHEPALAQGALVAFVTIVIMVLVMLLRRRRKYNRFVDELSQGEMTI